MVQYTFFNVRQTVNRWKRQLVDIVNVRQGLEQLGRKQSSAIDVTEVGRCTDVASTACQAWSCENRMPMSVDVLCKVERRGSMTRPSKALNSSRIESVSTLLNSPRGAHLTPRICTRFRVPQYPPAAYLHVDRPNLISSMRTRGSGAFAGSGSSPP